MANKTFLDFAINLESVASSQIDPIDRIANMVYFVVPKAGVMIDSVEITDKADIATYLDAPASNYANYLLDNGLNKFTFAFKGNITDIGTLSGEAYLLLMASGTDPQPSEIDGFDGVKVWIKSDETDMANELIAKTEKNCVVICDLDNGGDPMEETGEGFASVLVAKFLSGVANRIFSSLQYEQFTYTPKITEYAGRIDARDAQLSFLGNDQSTVVTPSLGYFRAGGKTFAEPFIAESLRQDLQTEAYNYILNNNSPYTNSEIGAITLVCQGVVDRYAADQLIDGSTNVVIPPRQDQTSTDIMNGKLNNFSVTYKEGSAIWWLSGTITSEVN